MDQGGQQGEGLLSYVSISGVVSLLGSACLYYLGKATHHEAEQLEKVLAVERLSEINSLVGLVPLLVAVTGRAGSLNPRQCELSDKQAVLYEVIEQDVFHRPSNTGGFHKEYSTTRRERGDTDWYLADDEGTTLRVDNSRFLNIEGSAYEIKERYEPKASTWTQAVVQEAIKAAQLVGHAKEERYIPVGTVLTVIGELARSPASPAGYPLTSPASRLVLRKPIEGPFLATNRSLTQLHEQLSTLSKSFHFWAVTLGTVGAALVAHKLGKGLSRAWVVWRAKQRLRRELARLRDEVSERGGTVSERGEGAGEACVCAVCLEGQLDAVWVPCGHLCLCQRCVASVDKCPMCRCRGKAIKVYRP